jgi:pimeloyl-ACP methyl ester carboxylesterase
MRGYGSFCIILLMVFVLFGCNVQDRLIYFPDKTRPSEKSLAEARLAFWKPYGDDYHGLVDARAIENAKGTIIVFHGNAGKAADRGFYTGMFKPLGYRVILAEYPGYGGRPGKPGERSFLNAGVEALDIAFREYGGPIYLIGESLGCGVVSWLAGHASIPVSGILLFTPWDTLASIAKEKVPSFVVSLALKDRYDSIQNLKTYNRKVVIVGAGRDEIIPVGHARALYDSYAGQKRMWTLPQAGHNDWPYFLDNVKVKEIVGFLSGP